MKDHETERNPFVGDYDHNSSTDIASIVSRELKIARLDDELDVEYERRQLIRTLERHVDRLRQEAEEDE